MKRMIVAMMILMLGFGTVLAAEATSQAKQAKKLSVIYDSDIGDDIDDTWALGFLLTCPEFDLKLVVGDNGKTEYRTKLFAKILESCGRCDVPVGIGLKKDEGQGGGQSAWVADYDLKQYPGKIYQDGVQAIIDTIMKSDEEIILLCVGPVQNIEEALKREPRIAEKAKFVGMHGSVRLGYGGSKDIHAEYNVKVDPKACQAAFSADWDMMITPLDTCGLVVLSGDRYAKVRNSYHPVAQAIMANYQLWLGDRKEEGKTHSSTLFDTVAVYLCLSQGYCTMEDLKVVVDDKGFTRISDAGKLMSVATEWKDMDAFKDFLVGRLTGHKVWPGREISVAEYLDKMKGGWVGQMAGVGWGEPTEFRHVSEMIPAAEVPAWDDEMVNQFDQDDIYVEMTFLRSLEEYGLDVSIRQAGIDFANSGYPLWHANRYGRENLRKGIAPPDSGHPNFSAHADDIDYQIEADFAGLISPGMPNEVIRLGEIFGRLMNYGDGLYGGQFVGGMYAEAFFEDDVRTIVEAGLACIPAESQYAECVRDVMQWYDENPGDWEATWAKVEAKYQDNPGYRLASCGKGDFNIDAKINGAYIVMGLLYGGGDMEKTIVVSMRCGQDSDCNPSSAAGILGTAIGFNQLEERYKRALKNDIKFSHTAYDFDGLMAVCESLTRAMVVRDGGAIVNKGGKEYFKIVERPVVTSGFEQCWQAGPIANSRYTDEEMEQINYGDAIREAVKKFAPDWSVHSCGPDMEPGMRGEWYGKKNVLMTHPLDKNTGCVLWRDVDVKAGDVLRMVVGYHPEGDWKLIVKVDGDEVANEIVGKDTCKGGWRTVEVPLKKYAGRAVKVELVNQPTGWSLEAGYWAEIKISDKL